MTIKPYFRDTRDVDIVTLNIRIYNGGKASGFTVGRAFNHKHCVICRLLLGSRPTNFMYLGLQ